MDQISPNQRHDSDGASERRARILDAAEHCFVRTGFHRATMQDVAAQAGMSPGNLYRYFPSKDAIVAGLAERDRTKMAAEFSALEHADNFVEAFAALGRKHFAEEPRERAILCLEIWAEATRNPAFAAMTAEFDRDVIGRITHLLRNAQERGAIRAKSDPSAIAVIIAILADGLFVRRAIAPEFDPEWEVDNIIKVIGAMLDGAVDLPTESRTNRTSL